MTTGTVLVTSAADYIGSHTVRQLSTGHRWAVSPQAELVVGNAGDAALAGALIEVGGGRTAMSWKRSDPRHTDGKPSIGDCMRAAWITLPTDIWLK